MTEQIRFVKDPDGITIKIPSSILKFAAENDPLLSLTIIDEDKFIARMIFYMEHGLADQETGLTGFQKFLDSVINEIIENGEDFVEFNEDY